MKNQVFSKEQMEEIKYWAKDEESMTATAGMMGLTSTKFIRDVRKAGLDGLFVAGCKSNARKAHLSEPRDPAIAKKSSQTRYGTHLIDGIMDTIKGHAERKGVGLSYTYELVRAGTPLKIALNRFQPQKI